MASGRICQEVREEIALLLFCNVDPREIARRFHCHQSTVYEYDKNIELFGELLSVPASMQGRPRKTFNRGGERRACRLAFRERRRQQALLS